MKTQVLLPADPLIDYYLFCKAIAQARHPAGEQELKGMDCIVGKMVTHHVPMPSSAVVEEMGSATGGWQSVLLSDDGRTLNQLDAEQPVAAESSTPALPFGGDGHPQMTELTLPYQLTHDDRQQMEKLLAHLPPLHYPMSEEERAGFMSAYFGLPNRPAWEPVLITATTIERRKAEQDEVMRHHQKAIQNEVAQGRLMAVNANHVPVAKLSVRDFLPRDQAIAYLTRCGMTPVDQIEDSNQDAEFEMPALHQASLDGKQGAVGLRKLSEKEKQDIVGLHKELKGNGAKGIYEQIRKKYSISEGYIRRLVREAKAEQDKSRIDKIWHKHP